MNNAYTTERNIQILISLLKKHNIKNIIASPGTTNISFVASVQNDNFFKVFSCVDERSASYMACGMAAETGEPVILSCTGATASRNYAPGLTEAFYRKLPVIAITATQHLGRVGQNIPQILDRSSQFKDLVKKSIQLTEVNTLEDAWACNLNVNDILLECRNNGGGPVHINMVTTYNNDFSCRELPDERKIERIRIADDFPKIKETRVAIFIGNHSVFDEKLIVEIEKFCQKYNGVVLCDHTSNYHGKYRILGNLICSQSTSSDLKNIDLLIDIGNISGAYMLINPKQVWRVNTDGIIRDTYKKLTKIFAMEELEFFEKYNSFANEDRFNSYYKAWYDERARLNDKLMNVELPFSNLWITKNTINRLEDGATVHLAILNTLRSWNYFETTKRINVYCNTGGFGIDGIVSSALGASLLTDENVYCIVGDLAFFYDLNSIGNRNVKNNLRIMLINNGCGTEFHNYNHRAVLVSKENNLNFDFFAADGHFGNKSKNLVKHYAEDLGFVYMSAENKEEFLKNIDRFTSDKHSNPIIFEVFTNPFDESEALKQVDNLDISMKNIAKSILGDKGTKIVRKVLRKR